MMALVLNVHLIKVLVVAPVRLAMAEVSQILKFLS